ncbi:hypothetical protein N0M98_00805 [Paenibacillus doosanensis]|uniref:hypothetical protein n=1 Tax=Paenibacillus doosanensis TaxID=1229154 RepID=UPI00217FA81B|nr:hypothetical protein [Paenibacillus doosanensis]MCS7458662.1 hypothetical protein [Paenibacillus doosanensis]
MRASVDIVKVWRQFDHHPMETLTKAWHISQGAPGRQRTVQMMEEHRRQFGTSGNCFDLALWLMHEFGKNGIESYPIGHHLHTPRAHVAVIAVGERGQTYFCDLGDQWIEPILIDASCEDFTQDELDGFVAGGRIKAELPAGRNEAKFTYIRPNGKISEQTFSLEPIEMNEFIAAANTSQSLLRYPLVEMRFTEHNEVRHWEFDRWNSFVSCSEGLIRESKLEMEETGEWARRIHQRTGMHTDVIIRALNTYVAVMPGAAVENGTD